MSLEILCRHCGEAFAFKGKKQLPCRNGCDIPWGTLTDTTTAVDDASWTDMEAPIAKYFDNPEQ